MGSATNQATGYVARERFPLLFAAYAAVGPIASRHPPSERTEDEGSVEPTRQTPSTEGSSEADRDRDRFAIRRLIRELTAEEHRLERLGREFEADEQHTKSVIEATWRTEHWGRAPIRLPSWRTHAETVQHTSDHAVLWHLSCRAADDGATICLAPTGELDLATVDRLDHALRVAQAHATGVTLDLRNLSFMDCSSLGLLAAAKDRAIGSGRRFDILRGASVVERLFEVTGTERLLESPGS